LGERTSDNASPEALDLKTREEWFTLSARVTATSAGPRPSRVNEELLAAARSDPESPVAPAYRLWVADNLAREARYAEAVSAFDAAIESAQSTPPFLASVDLTASALLHMAQAAILEGNATTAISTYEQLATVAVDRRAPILQAGLIAEKAGEDEQAAAFYSSAAGTDSSSKTSDPGELAARALRRLQEPQVRYLATARGLAELLAQALERGQTGELRDLLGTTHFAVGPLGGHPRFEDLELTEQLWKDLGASRVTVRRKLVGSGDKLYMETNGWKGEWFRGDVVFALTRAPKGWQWTGVALSQAHDMWIERWRPKTTQTNQPLPFELLAPWPAGQSFKAGGLTEFSILQTVILVGGILGGGILALTFARSPCGFGPRGFYYNQGSTHDEEDAFAIDFTRYRRNVPYDPETEGTPVLAARDGVIASAPAGTVSGDSSASNTVEIVHEDPAIPSDKDRFRSRYLHLAGPFMIPVSTGMAVRAGQRLGLMDDTGNSWLNHLHFSIHDRNIRHPNVSYGASIRPTPMSGVRLEDGDAGTCVRSTNLEYFIGQAGQLLFYRDATQDGTGDVSSPSVIGQGGWDQFKFLFSGGNGIIYAVPG
jgi:tetratricopeptide (TPR) repeat protein